MHFTLSLCLCRCFAYSQELHRRRLRGSAAEQPVYRVVFSTSRSTPPPPPPAAAAAQPPQLPLQPPPLPPPAPFFWCFHTSQEWAETWIITYLSVSSRPVDRGPSGLLARLHIHVRVFIPGSDGGAVHRGMQGCHVPVGSRTFAAALLCWFHGLLGDVVFVSVAFPDWHCD